MVIRICLFFCWLKVVISQVPLVRPSLELGYHWHGVIMNSVIATMACSHPIPDYWQLISRGPALCFLLFLSPDFAP